MSARTARFAFANDFSAGEKAPLHQFTGDELDTRLAERETAGYARGFDDGERAQAAHAGARIADAAGQIARQIESLDAALLVHRARIEAQSARLAFAFARRLAGSLLKDHLTAPLADAFRALLADLRCDERIVVAVHPSLVEAFDAELGGMLAGHRAALNLSVVGDPTLAPGDGRIDWDGGGLVLDAAVFERRLADLIARTYPESPPSPEETAHGNA